MSRWYYTDQLAAAWVRKHHGVQLQLVNNGIHHDIAPECELIELKGLKYYIHPGSLPLLEPQVGDIISFKDRFHNEGGMAFTLLQNEQQVTWALYKRDKDPYVSNFIIEKRNGLPFMWPEQEKE